MLQAFLTGYMHLILLKIVSKNVENHTLSQKILVQETKFADTKILFAPLMGSLPWYQQISWTS